MMTLACNPFASRFTKPGALDFLPSTNTSLDEVWARITEFSYRGQIVGPHGTGKSTLVAALTRRAEQLQLPWSIVRLNTGRRGAEQAKAIAMNTPLDVVLVVDGFEQLPVLTRARLLLWRSSHLIVTTHRFVCGFPRSLAVLARTTPSYDLAIRIAQQLLRRSLTNEESLYCMLSYDRHNGNIREMLFDLYDRYEQNRGHNFRTIAAQEAYQ